MAKGRKTGGRTRGTPNRVNSAAKVAFLATFGKLEGDLETWIRKTAEGTPQPVMVNRQPLLDGEGKPVIVPMGADPGKAADLLIRMAEYHFPKLGRTEVTGKDGEPVRVVVVDRDE
jgi:hypothetical protein